MSRAFVIDPPLAAMVVVSVSAIPTSRRVARPGVRARVLRGLATLTNETSVLLLAGTLAAVVLLGGWRNWWGLPLFAVGLALIAEPWYVYPWPNVKAEFTSIGQLDVDSAQSPPRFSARAASPGISGIWSTNSWARR